MDANTAEQMGAAFSSAELIVSCVLFRTSEAEVAAMIGRVQQMPCPALLILIDNDPEAIPRKTWAEGVLRIWTGANLGYGRAQNIAFNLSRGGAPFHLVANTDVEFDASEVAGLLDHMRAYPQIGLLAPRVRYPDGRLQHLCRLLPTPADLVSRRFFRWTRWGRERDRRYELKDWDYDQAADIPFLSGCFMLLRRSVLDRVGGFDPRFFLYWEDLDLSRRIHAVARTCFFPEVEIVHQYRSQSQSGWRTLRHLMLNAARYFNKWGWIADRERTQVNAATLAQLGLAERRDVASDA
jgi:GT2 family glycosyltransferase